MQLRHHWHDYQGTKGTFWALFKYPFWAFWVLFYCLLFYFLTNSFFPVHHHSAAALAWLPRQATSSFRNLGTFSRLKLDAIPNPNVVAFLHCALLIQMLWRLKWKCTHPSADPPACIPQSTWPSPSSTSKWLRNMNFGVFGKCICWSGEIHLPEC